jgi:hypothetical protein
MSIMSSNDSLPMLRRRSRRSHRVIITASSFSKEYLPYV